VIVVGFQSVHSARAGCAWRCAYLGVRRRLLFLLLVRRRLLLRLGLTRRRARASARRMRVWMGMRIGVRVRWEVLPTERAVQEREAEEREVEEKEPRLCKGCDVV
jgi:hypothetical protein